MQKYEQALEKDRKKIFVNNFLGGLAWALGSTIGLAIIATLFTFLLSKVDLIPIIGSYLVKLNTFMLTHSG